MGFSGSMNNNTLALLALVLIVISSMNMFIAVNFSELKETVTADATSASGIINLCAAEVPVITTDTYFEGYQGNSFFYDVNVSGDESDVSYTDNTTMFVITSDGYISFTPSNDDVGITDVLITTVESLCSLSSMEIVTFNITDVNDPPELLSLFFENSTANNTYDFYPGPTPPYRKIITGEVHIWEDVWYNMTLEADDPDLHVPSPNDSLRYGNIPPGLFVLNTNDGNATFMPVQSEVGSHSFLFNVIDSEDEIDESNWITINVHNTNDMPVLQNLTMLGARTTLSGVPFYLDVNATDEDGDTLLYGADIIDCNQTFRNASSQNCSIFVIDSSTGIIEFTPLLVETGNYTVNYTVDDSNGGIDWELGNFTVVENFNHPPNITAWWPIPYLAIIFEGDTQMFNITVVDPDSGVNSVSAEWFLNGTSVAVNMFEYNYTADYRSSGVYNVTVIVNDGWIYDPQTDSHEWILIVIEDNPPKSSGGRSGGSLPVCLVNWRCTDWSACNRDGEQIRTCVDLSMCGTDFDMPVTVRNCIYTDDPTCYDGVLNCHGGLCEVLADCGGPCSACPTCSDGIKNCHVNGLCEDNTDCGGPCAPCVELPQVSVCGNSVCEAGELNSCMNDCFDFWVDIVIFMMIIILLVIVSILLYVYRKETVLLYVYRIMKGE